MSSIREEKVILINKQRKIFLNIIFIKARTVFVFNGLNNIFEFWEWKWIPNYSTKTIFSLDGRKIQRLYHYRDRECGINYFDVQTWISFIMSDTGTSRKNFQIMFDKMKNS